MNENIEANDVNTQKFKALLSQISQEDKEKLFKAMLKMLSEQNQMKGQ